MSNPKVELHIAGQGVITLELDQDKATVFGALSWSSSRVITPWPAI